MDCAKPTLSNITHKQGALLRLSRALYQAGYIWRKALERGISKTPSTLDLKLKKIFN